MTGPRAARKRGLAGLLALAALTGALSTTLLAGCWDRVELEEVAWVMALGLDKAADGDLIVTAMIAVPRNLVPGGGGGGGGTGGGGPGGGTTVITSVEAGTLFEGFNLMNSYVSRRINVSHAKAVVFSEALAREGIQPYIGAITRYREHRPTMNLVVSRGNARDILTLGSPVLDLNPGRYIESILTNRSYTGFWNNPVLNEFVIGLQSDEVDVVAPLVSISRETRTAAGMPVGGEARDTDADVIAGDLRRTGGATVEAFGVAVFRGDRMVGTLTGEESRIMLMLQGTFRRAFFSLPDPRKEGAYFATEILRARALRVKVLKTKPEVELQVTVPLEGELLSSETDVDFSDPANFGQYEEVIRREIQSRIERLVRKAQKTYRADIFGWGNYAKGSFLTWPEWTSFKWRDRFPSAKVGIDVRMKLRRVGLRFKTPNVR